MPHAAPHWKPFARWITPGASLFVVIGLFWGGLSLVAAPPNKPPTGTAKSDGTGKSTVPKSDSKSSTSKAPPNPYGTFDTDIQPLLKTFCIDCHGAKEPEAGLELSKYTSVANILADRDHWEKVHRIIKIGAMPPSDAAQPSAKERERLVDWLDHTLYYVDCTAAVNPGRVTIRRLNRVEYNNTIRDLMGIDFEPAKDFPADDVGYGFDNIGDVLSVQPLLVEKYLDAAEQVVKKAILTADPDQFKKEVSAAEFKTSGQVHDGAEGDKVCVSKGEVFYEFQTPKPGNYFVRIEAAADQAGTDPAKMEVYAGTEKLRTHSVIGEDKFATYQSRAPLKGGKIKIEARFINDFYDEKQTDPKKGKDRNLKIRTITVEGPVGLPMKLPETHKRLVPFIPGASRKAEQAAKMNLKPFMERAFRRPVNDLEVIQYARFVKLADEREETFERGMQIAIQAVLVSPDFLFRVEFETPPAGTVAKKTGSGGRSLNSHELASRLSYFLWSSMPDDELLKLAASGELAKAGTLQGQVKRMLKDDRAEALIQNFGGQWLALRKISSEEVNPNGKKFPLWSGKLRQDMVTETEMLVSDIFRNDKSIIGLLDARYTFVNERLAKLYDIPNIKGDEFRKVDLKDGKRAGLLTQASILTLTSYPTRTSPVKRGEWILANILGDEPPPPPPVVPSLEETQKKQPNISLREALAIHRQDPGCAACHKVMDQIGFGFENFDGIGRWREKDGDLPIDSTGELPTGEKFKSALDFIEIAKTRKRDFARCLTEKLLTYALGRGLEYYDKCVIDQIVDEAEQADWKFSAIALGVVRSTAFRERIAEGKQ